LRDYDYAQAGAYFITICTVQRECLFGSIGNGILTLNDWGQVASMEWLRTPAVRPQVELDEFIVMPNHLHGIVVIGDAGERRRGAPPAQDGPVWRAPSQTIGAIVRGYKSAVTRQIRTLCGVTDTPVWQRNYYEHVIRDERELDRIRKYVVDNPARWETDGYGQATRPHRA